VRFQNQLSETLLSVLGRRERKRLEAYDLEKMGLLYRLVLEDSGSGANLQRLII
jgi:hypothetical protein